MNNKDFQKELARRMSLTQKEAGDALAELTKCMTDCFLNGDSVVIQKLGVLEPRKKAERVTSLPNATEKITVPARVVIGLKTAVSFKEKINQKRS